MSDPSEKLQGLQDILIDEFIRRIQSGEATAADLSAARQMLKDNGIQAQVTEESPFKTLVDSLPFEDEADNIMLAN
jgi:hypothetical protein